MATKDFKIGLIQLAVTESKKENLSRIISAIEESEASDLLVFPEYSMGYPNAGLSRRYLKDDDRVSEARERLPVLKQSKLPDIQCQRI